MTKTKPKPKRSNPAGPGAPRQPEQHPAEQPRPDPGGQETDPRGRWPPDSLPNPMPGLDPQQTPGIDRLAGPQPAVRRTQPLFHQERL
ncbi:hypothetical protein ACVCNH_15665 [Achromobacter anxifer]